jgi:hypothetical protein
MKEDDLGYGRWNLMSKEPFALSRCVIVRNGWKFAMSQRGKFDPVRPVLCFDLMEFGTACQGASLGRKELGSGKAGPKYNEEKFRPGCSGRCFLESEFRPGCPGQCLLLSELRPGEPVLNFLRWRKSKHRGNAGADSQRLSEYGPQAGIEQPAAMWFGPGAGRHAGACAQDEVSAEGLLFAKSS